MSIQKKRVLVAGFHHESNSFNPIITGAKDFSILRGNQVLWRPPLRSSMAGIVKTLQSVDCDTNAGSQKSANRERAYPLVEVVPILLARAVPNGVIARKFYDRVKAEILRETRKSMKEAPIDGITLALHGSMAVEGLDDPEGDLLEGLRELLPDIPLFVALDMHTTYTEKMHRNASGCVGYKCAPHTDCFETGEHAAIMTLQSLFDEVTATSAWVKIPFLVAGEKSETSTEPMKTLMATIRAIEQTDDVMAVSYLMGFPWADSPHAGVTALVVTNNNQELANFGAERWARLFWEYRKDFQFHTESYSPKEALQIAMQAVENGEDTPVYISDSGDNPTAGSSGDCTELLELILEAYGDYIEEPPGSGILLYGGIYDPTAVARAIAHNKRSRAPLTLTFGAAFDTKTTKPLTCTGEVTAVVRDYGPYCANMVVFSVGWVEIVLVSEHIGMTEPELFEELGVDPRIMGIVVCKLGYLTAPHKAIAARSIMALTKGCSNEVLETLPYKRIPRPMYPLDVEFEPEFVVRQ